MWLCFKPYRFVITVHKKYNMFEKAVQCFSQAGHKQSHLFCKIKVVKMFNSNAAFHWKSQNVISVTPK